MMLSFSVLILSSVLTSAPEKGVELEAIQRLNVAWSRAALQMISEPKQPTPENYAGALEIARAAAALVPNDSESLRIVLSIADATNGGVSASAVAANEAVIQLAKLDPNDLALRFLRLSDAVNRSMTAEARITAYEHLLSPESVAKITPAVASRLSFDYSLLLRRRGDADAALERLREAVKLDPAFPAATAQFAAYQLEMNAPLGVIANALVDAIVANPTDIEALKELGMMCLDEGLYIDADMILSVACRAADMNQRYEEFDKLLAQQMLARWGQGKHKQARELFSRRKEQLRGVVQRKLEEGQSTNFEVSLPSTMNTINAALSKSGSLPNADAAFADAIATTDDEITNAKENPAARAKLLLEKSWLTLGVGPNADLVPAWIAEAETINPLSPEAKARFDGWLKLRTGMTDEAITILKPLAEKNPGAHLGYALALAKIGQSKDAAKEFLAIVRANRSSAIGMYAADQLFEIVKSRIAPSAKAAEIQAALARLPNSFSKLATDDRTFIKVTAEFLSTTAKPFESLPLKIEITNLSSMTFAITPDGPIESRSAIVLETIANGKSPQNLSPIIFPIDRRLELAPNQTMSIVLGIERTPSALDLVAHPLDGANLQAEFFTNIKLTQEFVVSGFLGRAALKSSIRILPVVCNTAWREEAMGTIAHCDKPDDLVTLVLFAADLARRSSDASAAEELKEGWNLVTTAWRGLPAAAQAWTLMVLPREPMDMTEPIAKAAKESQDPKVQMSALLRWVDSDSDALFSTVERSGNEQLITIAASVRSLIEGRMREASSINQALEEVGVLGGNAPADNVAPKAQP